MKEESSSANLRRKYLHVQLEKRKQNKKPERMRVDRPRAFTQRIGNSIWKSRFKKLGILLGIGAVILAIIYGLFFSSLFVVTRVQVDKNGAAVTASQLQPFIDNLKGRNVLFINGDRVAQDLQASFPKEILFVKVKKSFPQKITLKIDEYPLVVNFHVNTEKSQQKLVINQIGFVVAQGTDFPDLPTLELNSPTELPIIEGTILSQDKLTPIVTGLTKFPELFGMKIVAGEWKKTERELHLKTEKGFTIWLDLTQDVAVQLTKLKRALTKLDIYNEKLDYIDLRIAGENNEKVIFKRKK